MDLRSMMNPADNGQPGAGSGDSKATSPPLSRGPAPTPLSTAPTAASMSSNAPQTPGVLYGPSVHASPVPMHVSSPHSAGHAHSVSPTAYHHPLAFHGGRPPHRPPPQAPLSARDQRSPGSASMSMPSPYRSSSYYQANTGHPGASPGQRPSSPAHRPSIGPAGPGYPTRDGRDYYREPRDSYSSQSGRPSPRLSTSQDPIVGMPSGHGPIPSMPYAPQGQQGTRQSTPGGGNRSYQSQRSMSIQSMANSTPTSGHSQHGPPGFGGYGSQASPVLTNRPPTFEQQRQALQTSTPLGPPSSGARQPQSLSSSSQFFPPGHSQPSSPYQHQQHRVSSSSSVQHSLSQLQHHPQHQHQGQHQHQQHHLSPPPQPPCIIRSNNNQGMYDPVSEPHRRSQSLQSQPQSHQSPLSRSERERSTSVSPKTRLLSDASSTSGAGARNLSISGECADLLPPQPQTPTPSQSQAQTQQAQTEAQAQVRAPAQATAPATDQLQDSAPPASSTPEASSRDSLPAAMDLLRDATSTPSKRKIDDRDLPSDEIEAVNRRPPPPKPNGNHVSESASSQSALPMPMSMPTSAAAASAPAAASTATSSAAAPASDTAQAPASPLQVQRRHKRYAVPPRWAQNGRDVELTASRNYTIQHKRGAHPSRAVINGNGHQQEGDVLAPGSRNPSPEAARPPTVALAPAAVTPADNKLVFDGRPFQWECCINFARPLEFTARAVGDFLFYHVLNNPHIQEIQARNVQIEIEAKLGNIIDRDTDYRVSYPLQGGECVLMSDARVRFESTMTEAQHCALNKYLNERVQMSHGMQQRVPIQYKHRRETDRFYELPLEMHARLPHAVLASINPRQPLKARITTDQKTDEILAKIVKGRVADLNLHLPHLPLDCRVSVNLEWDWDGPAEEIAQNQISNREQLAERNKDRLSYKHGFYQIDLTQVTQPSRNPKVPGTEKEHEIEIELDSKVVLDHQRRLIGGADNRYPDLIDGLLDNIRVLARACPPPGTE